VQVSRAAALATLLLAWGTPAAGTPFDATLAIEVLNIGPAIFSGSAQGTSSPLLVSVPAGVFSGTQLVPLTPMEAPPLSGVRVVVSGNGAGAFGGTPLGGPLALAGRLAFRGFGTSFLQVPFATPMGAGVGVGGTGMGVTTSFVLTLQFAEWATGAYTSPSGHVFQGLDSRTPGGLGQLTLVSPTRVVSNLRPPFSIVSSLTLEFVPEPATLLLLGAGAAALAWQARRKTPR
jgi:PEP-CTERM motif-containing protein